MNSKRKLILSNNPLLGGPGLQERERGVIPYREIPITLIDRDPNQPRITFDSTKLEELASSIKAYGVLSPILVRPSKSIGRYDLVAGERRFRASQMVGLTSIPALIDQDSEQSGERTLAMQLVENLQRADLIPLERAQAIGTLRDNFNLSVRDIADKLGVSKSMVQRSLEILSLPDDLVNALKEGASESKVLLLAKIEDPDIRASYLNDLETLTRAELQKNVDRTVEKKPAVIEGALSAEDRRIADEIQKALGMRARLSRSHEGSDSGKLVVEFYSDSDLQELFRKLVSSD